MIPERIEVDGDRVVFTWEDGPPTMLTARSLRAACECAVCREPQGAAAVEAVLGSGEPVTISDARLVGGYAIQFTFAPDGHGTGIYPFERLRSMESDASS